MTGRQLLAYWVARTLFALPARAQVLLSGRRPVVCDGEALAPEQQLALALLARRRTPGLETISPAQARLTRRELAAVLGGRATAVASVDDLTLGTGVSLRARHYAPTRGAGEPERAPLLVYLHGGGFLYGDLDTHDGVCRLLCTHGRAHVLAIDYRLAPEHPFPAAVEDARAALRWAHEHAGELGADGERVGIGGDSAGGNLAAVAAQLAAQDGGPSPALQLLIYPATQFGARTRSRELFGEGFLLTSAELEWFDRNYLGSVESADARDPRASPLLADDLRGLAPAIVVTAGFDPLRDEGEQYAHALRQAGNTVVLRRFEGFMHAFVNGAGVIRPARDAVIEIAGMMQGLFAHSGQPESAAELQANASRAAAAPMAASSQKP